MLRYVSSKLSVLFVTIIETTDPVFKGNVLVNWIRWLINWVLPVYIVKLLRSRLWREFNVGVISKKASMLTLMHV